MVIDVLYRLSGWDVGVCGVRVCVFMCVYVCVCVCMCVCVCVCVCLYAWIDGRVLAEKSIER